MPPFETLDLHQTAVRWPAAGRDPATGEVLRGEPEELRVRWVTGRRAGVDAQGSPVVLDAQVVTARVVKVDDLFWLGRLADFDPTDGGAEVMRAVDFDDTTDLKNRHRRTTANLQRFHGRLPDPVT